MLDQQEVERVVITHFIRVKIYRSLILFRNKKYLTSGSINIMPCDLIFALFILIEILKEKSDADYLQIFEITTLGKNQHFKYQIVHRQEQPEFKNEFIYESPMKDYNYNYQILKNCKVYIIDDTETEEGCTTVMLAEEY